MYSDYDLSSPWRRTVNCVLLQALSLRVREAFNSDFDGVFRLKGTTVDRIAEQNTRLREIATELRHMGSPLKADDERLLQPLSHPEESPEGSLVVTDAEVALERYVSPEERARLAAEAEEETRRAAAAAKDNVFEKALKQMMNGELASKDAAREVWTLEKPEWIAAGPTKWSEEQKKLAVQWAAEQKKLDDERTKRRQALEGEVRD